MFWGDSRWDVWGVDGLAVATRSSGLLSSFLNVDFQHAKTTFKFWCLVLACFSIKITPLSRREFFWKGEQHGSTSFLCRSKDTLQVLREYLVLAHGIREDLERSNPKTTVEGATLGSNHSSNGTPNQKPIGNKSFQVMDDWRVRWP